MTNAELKNWSGNVSSEDKLVCFLYHLGRDHLTLGVIEDLVRKSEAKESTLYTNGFLASYCKLIAERLK